MSIANQLLGSVLRKSLTWLSRKRLPRIDGQIKLQGLEANVEIIRDKWGVPHIFAATLHDLFFAQGFVEAQDRLFQMELNRRTARGLLSELFGAIALDTDRASRAFGFNRLGEIDWKNATSETRLMIQAYSDGVNAFLAHPESKLPIEFTLLNYRPKPWEPLDSMAFARVMLWQLSHAWYGEIVRAQLIEVVGAEHAAELEIHYPLQNPLILPNGIEFNRLDSDGHLQKMAGPFLKQNMGSNAWVVSAEKSDSHHACLCNDMHLALSTPCIWYEVHLIGAGLNVMGVTLPGVPCVMVGHNEQIAWGMTLGFTDCEDLFIEKFAEDDPTLYQLGEQWRKAEVIREEIPIKGKKEAHIEEVVITHHGPVVSDVVGYPNQRLAINSMALKPSAALRAWFQLNGAKNWDEFVEAMRLIDATQLGVTYADTSGNIGSWLTGKVPIRAKGDGNVPALGWTGEYEWVGEVPFEVMPYALNPKVGYLIHTNNRVIPADYPYFLGEAWMNGYRANRIEQVLKSKAELSLEDFQKLHVDFFCQAGIDFIARLSGINNPDADVQLALDQLQSWNGVLSADSVAGCIYEVSRYFLVRNLVEPKLGEALTNRWMGQPFNPVLKTASEFYGNDTTTMLRLLDDPSSWWVNEAGGREALLSRSLKQAIEWLRANLGENMDSWQWGKIHRAIFPHPLGLQKPLDLVFNRGYVAIGGDTDTPCQTAYKSEQPFDNNAWGPSFRQIVDMGDLSKALVATVPGQSGHLGSRHYDDFLIPWLKGEYHPMLWERATIEKESEGVLLITP